MGSRVFGDHRKATVTQITTVLTLCRLASHLIRNKEFQIKQFRKHWHRNPELNLSAPKKQPKHCDP